MRRLMICSRFCIYFWLNYSKLILKKEVVSINALSNTRENSEQTRFIKNTITNLYYEGNNAIWQSATEEVKLQSRIVDIHLNSSKSNRRIRWCL